MPAFLFLRGIMDLSNIQPIFKKFDNEILAEKYLALLSVTGGKKIDVISIYPKGNGIYVWFFYDRSKLGFTKPEVEGEIKASKEVNKKKKKGS